VGFRANIQKKDRIERISSHLLHFRSDERIKPLLLKTIHEPDEIFWPVFLEWWCLCDDTRHWQSEMLEVLERRSKSQNAVEFLSTSDGTFYDALPRTVPVFRGSTRKLVRCISWTTDRTIAEGYAHGHRDKPVPDAVVASAEIDKSAIFFVSVERSESEVVLNPRRLRRLQITDFDDSKL
jgi:hypothetical protein